MLNHIRTLFLAAAVLSPLAVGAAHAEDSNKWDRAKYAREHGKKCDNNADKRAERAERREHRLEHHKMHVALK
jgi:Ni/Co efflux regulator RcnB